MYTATALDLPELLRHLLWHLSLSGVLDIEIPVGWQLRQMNIKMWGRWQINVGLVTASVWPVELQQASALQVRGQTLVLLHHVSPGLCWFLLQLIKSFLRRLGVFNLGPQSSCEKEKCLHLMGSPFDVFPVFYFWLSEELQWHFQIESW